jgi:hypothetical protein
MVTAKELQTVQSSNYNTMCLLAPHILKSTNRLIHTLRSASLSGGQAGD